MGALLSLQLRIRQRGLRSLTAPPPPGPPGAGQLEAARVLLEKGASLELGCEGSPPLHVAVCVAAHGARRPFALAAAELLLQYGADPYDRWAWLGGAAESGACRCAALPSLHRSLHCCPALARSCTSFRIA